MAGLPEKDAKLAILKVAYLLTSDAYFTDHGLVLPVQEDEIPRHLFFNVGR